MLDFHGIKVVSFLPGRVRLKVDKLQDDAKFAKKVEGKLSKLASINLVEADPGAGKVLIKYDRKSLKDQKNIDALIKSLHALFPDADIDKLKSMLS
ncbi:MAG: hypothetical protein PVF34_03295 [Gammaproteobacteria bacterium]|jgi:hypothetical protein